MTDEERALWQLGYLLTSLAIPVGGVIAGLILWLMLRRGSKGKDEHN